MKNKQAFTLIELLVVVLIIGILAAVALPQYQKAVYKARYSKLETLSKAYEDALRVYHMANGHFPASFDELDIDLPAGTVQATPQASHCGTFNKMYCCFGAALGGYQANELTCGTDDYVLATKIFLDSNIKVCQAKSNNNTAVSVCKSVGSFSYPGGNLPTPAGHKLGYTSYAY